MQDSTGVPLPSDPGHGSSTPYHSLRLSPRFVFSPERRTVTGSQCSRSVGKQWRVVGGWNTGLYVVVLLDRLLKSFGTQNWKGEHPELTTGTLRLRDLRTQTVHPKVDRRNDQSPLVCFTLETHLKPVPENFKPDYTLSFFVSSLVVRQFSVWEGTTILSGSRTTEFRGRTEGWRTWLRSPGSRRIR